MSRSRLIGLILTLLVVAAAVTFWTVREARVQRDETRAALHIEAEVLAGTIGPSLAAAAAAARELEELASVKLLESARLFARLDAAGALGSSVLPGTLDDAGLDAIAVLDEAVRVVATAGEPLDAEAIEAARPVATGAVAEAVWGASEHLPEGTAFAAVARARGGAIVVGAARGTSFAFARQIGIGGLLENLVGTGGVLYLAYREQPGGLAAEVAWDRGPVPPPAVRGGDLSEPRPLRGRSVYELVHVVPSPAGRGGTLRIGLDAAPLARVAARAQRHTLLVGLVLALVGLLGAGFAAVSRLRADERTHAAERLARLDEQRRRAERLSAAGALAAGLAHEVRSPLNAISIAAQRMARRHDPDEECGDFARTVHGEIERLDDVLRGFLDLARPGSGEFTRGDLAVIAEEVARLVTPAAEEKGLVLRLVAERAEGRYDGPAIRRALLNLVRNAIDASPRGGTLEIETAPDAEWARIVVRDDGPGIAPGEDERLFEPFVTGRAGGTGLGLAFVRRVAEEHRGSARLVRRAEGGTEARLVVARQPTEDGA